MSSVQVLAGFSLRGSGSGVGMEKKNRNDDSYYLVRVLISFCFWMSEKPAETISMIYTTFIYSSYYSLEQLR